MIQHESSHIPDEFARLLERICKNAADLLGAKASSVFLREGDHVVMRGAFGYNQSLVHKAKYQIGEGITGWIARGNEFFANSKEKIEEHPSYMGKYDREIWGSEGHRCNSILGVPLYIGDEVYGLIKVENKSQGETCLPFTTEDLENLRIFLRAISDAIQTNSELMAALGRLYVFVLIPFTRKFKNIFEMGIMPAVQKAGMRCEKVEDIEFNDDILQQIYACISKADIVISVMTGKNANVFYETGYSHAMAKPTVHLAESVDDIPFDLSHYNHIIYDPEDLSGLNQKIERRLLAVKTKLRDLTRNKTSITTAWNGPL
jgi:nucleoside 2-deoxyribosyltransferase